MDIKDLKAHFRAEKEEREAQPWFIRIPVNVGEFLYYRVWEYIKNFPTELRWEYQRFIRGYADEDVWDVGSYIIDKLHGPLQEFVQFEEENGISLPTEFETDPAAWLVVLSKIRFSVNHTWKENHDVDYNPTKGMGIDEKKEFYARVDEGFLLLGKYLRSLWD